MNIGSWFWGSVQPYLVAFFFASRVHQAFLPCNSHSQHEMREDEFELLSLLVPPSTLPTHILIIRYKSVPKNIVLFFMCFVRNTNEELLL